MVEICARARQPYAVRVEIDVQTLADTHALGALFAELRARHGGYDLVAHWTQGEFHHDLVLRAAGVVLVVSANCNGGVKEVLVLDDVPERGALWKHRCPHSDEFVGTLGPVRALARTPHWFDPCELLRDDARSELKPSCRRRQPGGGWESVP